MTNREAAADWVDDQIPDTTIAGREFFCAKRLMDAHLSGQECGEKREREAERAATVAWLRMIEKRTRDYSRPSTESLLVADEYDYIARTIMSGEHRGGE